ncbi:MAG: hypothetical protein ACJAY5_000546 [Actinomycetes bacterium]|jgi:hypothetical protein
MTNISWSTLRSPDTDDVNPYSINGDPMIADPFTRQSAEALKLLGRDRRDWTAIAITCAGFDLTDDQGRAVKPHHVDLAAWSAPVPIDDDDSGFPQITRGNILAIPSECFRTKPLWLTCW